jgi:tetratricopeptide (TPR) repeat protein
VDKKLFGEHSLRAARDYADLAKVYLGEMKLTRATDAAQKAQMIYALLLPSNHPELAAALNNLAVVYYYAGDYQIAGELQQAALRADAASFATATTEASVAGLNNMATLAAMQDPHNPDAAIDYYNKAIAAETTITDGDPVRLASLYINLGLTYENAGDFKQAADAYENAVKQIRWALGVENQLTAEAYRNLARSRFKLGDMAEAEKNYKYFLKITYPQDEHADYVIRMLEDFNLWRASEAGPQFLPRYLGPEPDPHARPRYLGQE